MSIYNRSVESFSSEDVAELLAEGAVENVRLEFMREVPGKDETLKKLSSFANTFGAISLSEHGLTVRTLASKSYRAFL